jgi:hypothetical protein
VTQIGETVDVKLIASNDHDDSCYFCGAEHDDPVEEENDVDDDPDDDAEFPGLELKGVKFKNDASKLGKAIGGTPDRRKVELNKKKYKSGVAAHHLIPGNAALKQSQFFLKKKYLWTSGKAKANIKYNVNSQPNGVWLPGNYAVRPWSGKAPKFQGEYATSSIEKWERQFHDAHFDYSEHVRKSLDVVFSKLERSESIVCPKAAKKKGKKPEEQQPLYALVARFHTISGRMRRMLVFPYENWFRNVFTSRFSHAYMNAVSPPRKRARS